MAVSRALSSAVAYSFISSLKHPILHCKDVPGAVSMSSDLHKSRSLSVNKTRTSSEAASDQPLMILSSPPGHPRLPKGRRVFTDDPFEQKLKEVKCLLTNVEDSLEGLVMVDALQRLGIDYHFEEEIRALLQVQHSMYSGFSNHPGCGLYEVALRFRLLRQGGYNVSADIFEGFKDSYGGFASNLRTEIAGLMSLYEASHLSTGEGDEILDEAAEFSGRALDSISTGNHLDSHEVEVVRSTLANPFNKSLPRFTSTSFRSYLKRSPYRWTTLLEELAGLDSNRVRSINQKEILQISKWWRDLGLGKELTFARDEPLKWYVWPMVMLEDPLLSEERVALIKPISLIYIIDDVFDVYGTVDELTLFTEAVNRWECIDELPDYMKTCFHALDRITSEISLMIYKKHGWDPTQLLRKSWARLCDAFLVEARWFSSGQTPAADDYLRNGLVSSGVDLVMVHVYAILSEVVDQHTINILDSFSDLSSSAAKILRLSDDLGGAEDESQEGHDGSYAEYYMNENPSCSAKGARDHVKGMIAEAWKRLNKESLFPHPFSSSFVKASLNLARIVPLMYGSDSNHNLQSIDEYMKSLLLRKYEKNYVTV